VYVFVCVFECERERWKGVRRIKEMVKEGENKKCERKVKEREREIGFKGECVCVCVCVRERETQRERERERERETGYRGDSLKGKKQIERQKLKEKDLERRRAK
jgi:hypothetical protein